MDTDPGTGGSLEVSLERGEVGAWLATTRACLPNETPHAQPVHVLITVSVCDVTDCPIDFEWVEQTAEIGRKRQKSDVAFRRLYILLPSTHPSFSLSINLSPAAPSLLPYSKRLIFVAHYAHIPLPFHLLSHLVNVGCPTLSVSNKTSCHKNSLLKMSTCLCIS